MSAERQVIMDKLKGLKSDRMAGRVSKSDIITALKIRRAAAWASLKKT